MGQVNELIKGLRKFQTRSACMEQLIELGEEAVEALVETLGGNNDAIVWSAIRALGEIGSPKAVPALIELLENRSYSINACDALKAITGERHSNMKEEWLHLLGSAPSDTPNKPLLGLVKEAISGTSSTANETSNGVSVSYNVGAGRSQKLIVMETKDREDIEIVAVYSECGPAEADKYEWALRKNLSFPHGAFAIRKVDDKKIFVAVNAMFRSGLTATALNSAMRTLAKRADKFELALTGKDEL